MRTRNVKVAGKLGTFPFFLLVTRQPVLTTLIITLDRSFKLTRPASPLRLVVANNIGHYMGLEPTASNTDWTNSRKTNLALLDRSLPTLERGLERSENLATSVG